MSDREFVRPDWRDGRAFARVLPEDCVSEKIIEELARKKDSLIPLKNPAISAVQEAEKYHTCLVNDLRVIDFGQFWYWIVMLSLCIVFLLCELGLVTLSVLDQNRLKMFQMALIVCLVGLVVLLLLYLTVALLLHVRPQLPSLLARIPISIYHALPVFWVSLFNVSLNFYIVTATGNSLSPFLPALLTASLVTLSLPRENSKLVLCLAIISLAVGLFGAATTSPVSEATLKEWGGQQLATRLNILTFLFSGVSVVLLRSIANYKVAK